jgi:hypothetical protein
MGKKYEIIICGIPSFILFYAIFSNISPLFNTINQSLGANSPNLLTAIFFIQILIALVPSEMLYLIMQSWFRQ